MILNQPNPRRKAHFQILILNATNKLPRCLTGHNRYEKNRTNYLVDQHNS
jgi:hypothetical protein